MERPNLDQIVTHLKYAQQELSRLCAGHSWKMSYPMEPTDSDAVIENSLLDVSSLVEYVEYLGRQVNILSGIKQEVDHILTQNDYTVVEDNDSWFILELGQRRGEYTDAESAYSAVLERLWNDIYDRGYDQGAVDSGGN